MAAVFEVLVVGDVFQHLFLFHEEIVFAVDFLAFGGSRRVGNRVGELVGVVGDQRVFYVTTTWGQKRVGEEGG